MLNDVRLRFQEAAGGCTEMSKDQLFVERRPQGDYAVRRPNSERASDVKPTQGEAIQRAASRTVASPISGGSHRRLRYAEGCLRRAYGQERFREHAELRGIEAVSFVGEFPGAHPPSDDIAAARSTSSGYAGPYNVFNSRQEVVETGDASD
jgi:hypothetical protein